MVFSSKLRNLTLYGTATKKNISKIRSLSATTNLGKLLGRLRRDNRGNVAIIFAILIIPVLTLIGGAVDYSNALRLRQQLTATIDSAALAAGSAVDLKKDERETLAKNYIEANIHMLDNVTIHTPDINVNEIKNTVTITVSGSVETYFLGIMGLDNIDVSADVEVALNTTRLEIALVLDTTGSMAGSKIRTLRTAAANLIEALHAGEDGNDNVKISVVPFNILLRIDNVLPPAPWLYRPSHGNCVGPYRGLGHLDDSVPTRANPIVVEPCFQTENTLVPLTDNKSTLLSSVRNLKSGGSTYISLGLAWGWRTLSPSEPLTEGKPYDDKEWKKILILMTDGQNSMINYGYGGPGVNNADENTKILCRNIKAAGINIYSVAHDIRYGATKNMIKECASNESQYFDARNNQALIDAFGSIAGSLSQLRISK